MAPTPSVQYINSAEELQTLLSSTTYVIIDFYTDVCPPCRAIAPVYDQLAAKHASPSHLVFAKVDVYKLQSVANAYNITAMPTFLYFKEGKQVAVNGQAFLRGADPTTLRAAAEKLGALAAKRAAGEVSA